MSVSSKKAASSSRLLNRTTLREERSRNAEIPSQSESETAHAFSNGDASRREDIIRCDVSTMNGKMSRRLQPLAKPPTLLNNSDLIDGMPDINRNPKAAGLCLRRLVCENEMRARTPTTLQAPRVAPLDADHLAQSRPASTGRMLPHIGHRGRRPGSGIHPRIDINKEVKAQVFDSLQKHQNQHYSQNQHHNHHQQNIQHHQQLQHLHQKHQNQNQHQKHQNQNQNQNQNQQHHISSVASRRHQVAQCTIDANNLQNLTIGVRKPTAPTPLAPSASNSFPARSTALAAQSTKSRPQRQQQQKPDQNNNNNCASPPNQPKSILSVHNLEINQPTPPKGDLSQLRPALLKHRSKTFHSRPLAPKSRDTSVRSTHPPFPSKFEASGGSGGVGLAVLSSEQE